MTSAFESFDDADVSDLIREYPLAWVQSPSHGAATSSLLPLVAETDGAGRLVSLLGHMARANPLFQALTASPRASILFQGPQSFISPSWVRLPSWAPTWNFAQLRIDAEIVFNPEAADEALETLMDAMEGNRPDRWQVANMGPRYEVMKARIVAFRATVHTLSGRFKLGQDERPEILADILAHMPDADMARWMRRFNPGRC